MSAGIIRGYMAGMDSAADRVHPVGEGVQRFPDSLSGNRGETFAHLIRGEVAGVGEEGGELTLHSKVDGSDRSSGGFHDGTVAGGAR